MGILNTILALITAYSGLLIGLLLAKFTKEELKPGKKYFEWMQALILIGALLAVFYSYSLRTITFIGLSIIVTAFVIKSNPKAIISYYILTILFILSQKNINLLIFVSSLIFLYGLPTGAIITLRGLKMYMKEEFENPTEKRRSLLKKSRYVAWVIMLEIIVIPTLFMIKKKCALYHLKFVCPICPSSRKKHRDVHGKSTCWWEYNWNKKNYSIPKHFGINNWIKQYVTGGTNLKRFKDNE